MKIVLSWRYVEIREGNCYVFGREILYISNPRIDYSAAKTLFFYKNNQYSLNQAPEAVSAAARRS
jgi:hypothetical protein